ncbi:MAG: monooxygenase [Stappia sp.]|uniref:FAD-dependent monooxygenase n=1 Tax=Stappia sp. TaxID=1870903 RepID=UPI000C4B7BC7|nr:FAD-dependent monooxygenase [Stappia sp.]MAA97137.1 monooxygenase [Stappia sp.]MBM22413.1 monooxygenase [Stappia sp.]
MSTLSPAREPLLIAGAGIGGLTTAVALSRRSIPSVVVEQAEELAPVGSGLQLSPNAVHVLRRLGLEEALLRHAVAPRAVSIQGGESGRTIAEVPLGATAVERYGAPYLVIHRADLQGVLHEAAKLSAGITLTFGTGLVDARQTEGRVRLTTERNGLSDILAGSGLVAADGVWSTVRRKVMNIRQAVYSGRTAYRAVIPIDDVPPEWRDVTGLWMGRDAHVVHYPVSAGTRFNIVVVVKEDWREETWSGPADRGALLARFARWSPRCRGLLERPESWLKWALCGMDPGMRWVDGRVALLGDAAHAMLPFAAQGAAMSIEDADALARAMETAGDVPEAFAAYEAARHGRAERVLRLARENDRIYHMSGPMAFARDMVMRTLSPERLLARLDWLYGWQPPRDA